MREAMPQATLLINVVNFIFILFIIYEQQVNYKPELIDLKSKVLTIEIMLLTPEGEQ